MGQYKAFVNFSVIASLTISIPDTARQTIPIPYTSRLLTVAIPDAARLTIFIPDIAKQFPFLTFPLVPD